MRYIYIYIYIYICRSQWPRGLRRRSVAARLLRSCIRIPPGAWMFVCCECCVLSGTGLCDELITPPEESYRLWCVVCDLETSRMRRPRPALGRSTTKKKNYNMIILWDHRHICGPSLTETSLCGAYLYTNIDVGDDLLVHLLT